MRRPSRAAVVVMVLLTAVPSGALLASAFPQGPAPLPPPPQLQVVLEPGWEVPLDCPSAVTLVLAMGADALAPSRSRFAVLSLLGAEGALTLDGVELGVLEAAVPTHVLLRVDEAKEHVLVHCIGEEASARLALVDVPAVEPSALPARVLGATFTRPGLRALGQDNLLEVYVPMPGGGSVSLRVHADGSPLPSTVQAFGEDANATLAAANRTLAKVIADPPSAEELAGTIVRLALACGQPPAMDPDGALGWLAGLREARPAACGGIELGALLKRYAVPAPAATDLAGRLATDARCSTAALLGPPPPAELQPAHAAPCAEVLVDWLDAALRMEGLPTTRQATSAALHALGAQQDFTDKTLLELLTNTGSPLGGPCADPVRAGQPFDSIQNRTKVSRQLDCLELLVASLRPLRLTWNHEGLVHRIGSLDYGLGQIALEADDAGQGKVTLSSQGPVIVDLTVALALPTNVGEALAPVEQLLTDVPPVLGLEPVDVPALMDALKPVPLSTDAAATAAPAVVDAANAALAPLVATIDAALPTTCTLAYSTPNAHGCPIGALPAGRQVGAGQVPGVQVVWTQAPARQLPEAAPQRLVPSQPLAAVAGFLAVPGTPLATSGLPPGPTVPEPLGTFLGRALDNAGHTGGRVFVPHRLSVRFDDAPPYALPSQTATAGAFAAERLADLRAQLGHDAGAALVDPRAPAELLLDGIEFEVTYDDGVVTARRLGPGLRVLNLQEGLALQDLDLDGVSDAREVALLADVRPNYGQGEIQRSRIALDPFDPDSDGDGMPDGYELAQCSDGASAKPLCPVGLVPWEDDAGTDADADLLPNGAEAASTLAAAEGTACFARLRWRCVADAAADALAGACVPDLLLAWSPPDRARSRDSDCDRFEDGWEALLGYRPADRSDPAAEADGDGDGLTTAQEFAYYQAAVAALQKPPSNFSRGSAVQVARTAGPLGALLLPGSLDSDDDGLPDSWEAQRGRWPPFDEEGRPADPERMPRRLAPLHDDAGADFDADGLTTLREFTWSYARRAAEEPKATSTSILAQLPVWGLDPFLADTDGDGLDDRLELDGYASGLPCHDPIVASLDCDGDGLDDRVERFVAGLPQTPAADAWAEDNYPCVLTVGELAARSRLDWQGPDSDGDGMAEWYECWFGLDPTDPADTGADADVDGLTAAFEYNATLDLHTEHRGDVAYFDPAHSPTPRALLPSDRIGTVIGDSDEDGLPDAYELGVGLDPLASDTGCLEGDLDDAGRCDADRDGLSTFREAVYGIETHQSPLDALEAYKAEGLRDAALLAAVALTKPKPLVPDSDGDGMADGWETRHDLDPRRPGDAAEDADADGASSGQEWAFAAARQVDGIQQRGPRYLLEAPGRTPRPNTWDTDGDGIHDGFELHHGQRQGCRPQDTWASGPPGPLPLYPHCFDVLDARDEGDDYDFDGLTNLQEAVGWDVTVKFIKTGEGINATFETRTWRAIADPLTLDTAGSGLSDLAKAPRAVPGCPGAVSALDPYAKDTDGDGVSDRVEVWEWSAVQGVAFDIDGDCFLNPTDTDSDGDSYLWGNGTIVDLADGAELDLKISDPLRHDTDDDGANDGLEIYQWRSANHNPVNETTDFDKDNALPLRDWDSDGDDIPDGYEFRFGIKPWEYKPPAHDTDDDWLPDLCEYRITVDGNLTPCRDGTAGETGEGALLDGQGIPAHDAIGRHFCVAANDPDCDGDGIHDGFEWRNANLAGCKAWEWRYHLVNGEPDACLKAYGVAIAELGGTLLAATFVEHINKPRIRDLHLTYDFALNPSQEACFYHRQCRVNIVPSQDMQLVADIAVEDRDCNLERLQLALRPKVQANRDPLQTLFDEPARPEQEAECVAAREAGVSYFYAFRAKFPARQLTQDNDPFGGLSTKGTLRLLVVPLDREGRVDASFATDLTLAGKGYNFLDEANQKTKEALTTSILALGKSLLTSSAAYLDLLMQTSRSEDPKKGVVYAQRLVASGMQGWMNRLAWFDSQGYLEAMQKCGQDPNGLTAQALTCKPVYDNATRGLGSKVKYIAGMSALRDLDRPVAEGLTYAFELLFAGGATQSDVATWFRSAYGNILPLPEDAGASRFGLWDWFVPSLYVPDGQQHDCLRSHTFVNALRGTAESFPPAPGVTPSILAIQRFDAVRSYIVANDPMPLDLPCLSATLTGHGMTPELARQISMTAALLALELTSLGTDAAALPGDYKALGSAFAFRRAVATAQIWKAGLSFAWFILDYAMSKDESTKKLRFAGCVVVSALGMAGGIAGTIASAGTASPLTVAGFALSTLHLVSCFQGRTGDRLVPPPHGMATGLGHSWEYRVETFPDIGLVLPGENGPDGRPLRSLARIKFDDIELKTQETNCGSLVAPRFREWRIERFYLTVEVERMEGRLWVPEFMVRFVRNQGSWTIDGSNEDATHRIRFSQSSEAIEAEFYGEVQAGLRRVTMTGRAEGQGYTNRALDAEAPAGQWVSFPRPSDLPMSVLPPYRWTGLGGRSPSPTPQQAVETVDYRKCNAPPISRATLIRGIGADLEPAFGLRRTTIQSVSAGGTTQLTAPDAPRGGPGEFLYYWDVGGFTDRAILKKDPNEAVIVNFPLEGNTVYLAVVNAISHRSVSEGYKSFGDFLLGSPSKASVTAIREGTTLTVRGIVSDPTCAGYRLEVGGQLWGEATGCAADTNKLRVQHTQTVAPGTLPIGSNAILHVLRNGVRVNFASVQVSSAPAAPLADGPVTGWFNGAYPEVDTFTYTAPPGTRTLQLQLRADPRMRFEVQGPGVERTGPAGTGLVVQTDGSPGATWTVRTFSNGARGCYQLWTNAHAAPSEACNLGYQCGGPVESCVHTRGLTGLFGNQDVVVGQESFDREPDAWNRWTHGPSGPNDWHIAHVQAASGGGSAHPGNRAQSMYPAYEDGNVQQVMGVELPLPPGFTDVRGDDIITLRFKEWNRVDQHDAGHKRIAGAFCSGTDGAGKRVLAASAFVFQDRDSGGWRDVVVPLNCDQKGLTRIDTIIPIFTFISTRNPAGSSQYCWKVFGSNVCRDVRALGWFVDDVTVAVSPVV